MKQTGPLLGRLVLWQSVTLAVTLVAFSAILIVTLSRQLRSHHDEEIMHTCRRARDTVQRHGSGPLDDPRLLRDLEQIGRSVALVTLPPGTPAPDTPRNQISLSTRTVLGGMLRVASCRVERPGGGSVRLEVTEPLGDVDTTINQLKLAIFTLVPVVLAAASLITTVLVHRALRPLQVVVRSAAHLGATSLDTRVTVKRAPREIAELARTFNQMIERLDASFSQVHRFTANASHELRTPLSALTATLEVALQRARTEDEYRQILGDALDEVQRLNRIVQNLLVMAQADADRFPLGRKVVDLDQVLEDAVEGQLAAAEEHDLQLLLQDGQGLHVHGDASWLRQLFDNLLDNAVKYTPAGGRIQVETRRDAAHAEVLVRDTGPGVPPGDRERIFERFHRAEGSRERNAGGVGLGLAIARWVAEAHGGSLQLAEEPGQGATFLARLPLAGPEDADAAGLSG